MNGKLHRKEAGPVNAPLHDEFVSLVALFYSGELTDEEWSLLQVHLAYCDECKDKFEQYRHIATYVIPEMAASAGADIGLPRESDRDIAEAEKRLLQKVGTLGSRERSSASSTNTAWLRLGGLAACGVVLLASAAVYLLHRNSWSFMSSSSSAAMSPPVAGSARVPTLQTTTAEDWKKAAKTAEARVADLQQKLDIADGRNAQPHPLDKALREQIDADRAEQQRLSSERDNVSKQLADSRADVISLREQISSAQANADQQSARATAFESKVRELSASLEEVNTSLNDKERILALDKDFLAHDRDIRDVIGARNLYIADIFDTNENGKTAKPFGRIFYTKDRSLVFYGFDLEKQSGLKQTVAFQAWGSGNDKQPASLGLFYQDDTQKRWVLRCNDAKALARMNMVFVTVEPPGGSTKPTGKQLLRAYLQIQPNHL